ncbi:hypothetical protein Goklo_027798 [Gossypium klotzschianum]|uniref:Sulfotransferase n=1 Tax=Gossypium klotzschianum TaxID=34286 RepID=A0A7J8TZD5_9ROSI|nr:hypothetical protein [Gossypium klotzschianum]
MTDDGSTSFIEGLSSPRLLSTHLPYSLLPKRMTDDGSACRFIYICRNPIDVFVSQTASVESPKKVLLLKYEDVKKKPLECVRKVAKFLEIPFTPDEENNKIVKEIVELCSFENLSNQDVNKSDVLLATLISSGKVKLAIGLIIYHLK